MSFLSLPFLGFLCIVGTVGYLMPRRARYIWLLAASYLFYWYSPQGPLTNLPTLGLLLFVTLVGYACGLGIGGAKKHWLKGLLLGLSIGCNLGLFVAFRYLAFGQQTGLLAFSAFNLLRPLGIGFFTLQGIAYAIDVYRSVVPAEKNLARYALFTSFFPSVAAGPIARASQMLPQYAHPAPFNYARLAGGAFRILWGAFKKMVIADLLSPFTAGVLSSLGSFSGPAIALASLAFALQLTIDFSALFDVLLGAAAVLGIDLPENFQSPFAAKTFPDLFRRWHASLTSFLNDYVLALFTKPGKNSKPVPAAAKFIGIVLSFVLLGAWHGLKPGYLLWGLACGILVALGTLVGPKKDKFVSRIPLYRTKPVRGVAQCAIVNLGFAACGVLFASAWFSFPLSAWLRGFAYGWGRATELPVVLQQFGISGNLQWVLPAAIVLVTFIETIAVHKKGNVAAWARSTYFYVRWPLYIILILALLFFGVLNGPAFMLLQF